MLTASDASSPAILHFLKHCYKFVNYDWQHCVRESTLDQGFEQRFRENCMVHLKDWQISQEREMHLGLGLDTASGVSHEVDIVARHPYAYAIVEMKNRHSSPPEKNDVIVFFAKIIDYIAFNPELALEEICPVFISNTSFEQSGLAACLGLGIHPIAPGLRPLPMLSLNVKIMNATLDEGLVISDPLHDQYEDFKVEVKHLASVLSETWFSSRCGYQSETTIVLSAVGRLHTIALSQQLRKLNAECTDLLAQFRQAKGSIA